MDSAAYESLARWRNALTTSTRITVLSGAGISAASGIPTFRGKQDSLWSRYNPQELATPEAFHADSELVWRWYDWRRGLIAEAEPNAAHRAIADLAGVVARVTIITQNVDGLHQRAGSRDILEFHGSIWMTRCLDCGAEREDLRVPIPILPRCKECDGLVRPGVVWFGEGIDPGILAASMQAARDCDLFLVVGTSGNVYPAAGLVAVAGDAGADVIEFNIESSGVSSHADLFVPGSAAETLPGLLP